MTRRTITIISAFFGVFLFAQGLVSAALWSWGLTLDGAFAYGKPSPLMIAALFVLVGISSAIGGLLLLYWGLVIRKEEQP